MAISFSNSFKIADITSYKTMGVQIDMSNSNPETSCTYILDAENMIPSSNEWDEFFGHRPCLFKDGEVVKYLNPNDFTKDVDGNVVDITSGDAGDVMIEFPRRGLTISKSGDIVTIKMTDDVDNLDFGYLAYTRGEIIKDNFYIGAYKGYNLSNKLRSISAKLPTNNITSSNARTYTQANGAGYDMVTWFQHTYIQSMFILKYKTLDSQSAIGEGNTNASNTVSNRIASGGCNTRGMDWGGTDTQQVKLFGIEDLWGNNNEYREGLQLTLANKIIMATQNFNNTGSGYIDTGFSPMNNTVYTDYISNVVGNNIMGFIMANNTGSQTTYFCDMGIIRPDQGGYYNTIPMTSGSFTTAKRAGLFTLNFGPSHVYTDIHQVGRIMYL